jgi:predicted acyl esterase
MRFSTRALILALCVLPFRAAAQDRPFCEAYPSDDSTVREAMVPMRDGVKLYTLILTPSEP